MVVVNTVAGTAIAWVLVRDQFPGKRMVASLVDLPFALPTIVAGLTLLSLYGPDSPFHLDAPGTRFGVWIALAFVTLPFSVRAVQPVLAELDRDAEEAASSLGASSPTVFRRIVLPEPGAGDALRGHARLRPGDGRVRLARVHLRASGRSRPRSHPVRIFGLYENGQNNSAAAVSLALLSCPSSSCCSAASCAGGSPGPRCG